MRVNRRRVLAASVAALSAWVCLASFLVSEEASAAKAKSRKSASSPSRRAPASLSDEELAEEESASISKSSRRPSKPGPKPTEKKAEAPSKKVEESVFREPFYPYKVVTILGVNALRAQSGFVMGAQFGFAPHRGKTFYIGPEVAFTLFSPGSVISTLMGAWYEMRIFQSPRLSLAGGVLLGAGFSSGLTIRPTSFMTFFEAILSQDITDLYSIRAQLRPGIIDGSIAFVMNFNIVFRFP